MDFFKRFTLIVFLFTLVTVKVNAQFYKGNQNWFAGVQVGMNAFWGDVDDGSNHIVPGGPFQSGFYKNHGIVGTVHFGKEITPFLTMRLQFRVENLKGQHRPDSLRFASPLNFELTALATIDILDLANANERWDFYPIIGIGAFAFRSTLYDMQTSKELDRFPQKETTIGKQKYGFSFALPFGLGVNFRATPRVHVNFETVMTWMGNDGIDIKLAKPKSFEGIWRSSLGVSFLFDSKRTQINYNSYRSSKGKTASGARQGIDPNLSDYKDKLKKGNVVTDFKGVAAPSASQSTTKVKYKSRRATFTAPPRKK